MGGSFTLFPRVPRGLPERKGNLWSHGTGVPFRFTDAPSTAHATPDAKGCTAFIPRVTVTSLSSWTLVFYWGRPC